MLTTYQPCDLHMSPACCISAVKWNNTTYFIRLCNGWLVNIMLSMDYKLSGLMFTYVNKVEIVSLKNDIQAGLLKVGFRSCRHKWEPLNWPFTFSPSVKLWQQFTACYLSLLSVPTDKPWGSWKEAIHHDITWYNYSLETQCEVEACRTRTVRKQLTRLRLSGAVLALYVVSGYGFWLLSLPAYELGS